MKIEVEPDDRKKGGARCFYEGYRVGRRGEPRRSPYPSGSRESWSWIDGWIEGTERRRHDTRKLDTNREH